MDQELIDVWNYTSKFIKYNKDTCYLMMTCRDLLKCKFLYHEKIAIRKIIGLHCYNYFSNVVIDDFTESNTWDKKRSIYISHFINISKWDKQLPMYISHFTIDGIWASMNIEIPLSVTHLNFKSYFDYFNPMNIPTSVTHLKLSYNSGYDVFLKNIPSSITHLTLNGMYYQKDLDSIPKTVKYLTVIHDPPNLKFPASVIKTLKIIDLKFTFNLTPREYQPSGTCNFQKI